MRSVTLATATLIAIVFVQSAYAQLTGPDTVCGVKSTQTPDTVRYYFADDISDAKLRWELTSGGSFAFGANPLITYTGPSATSIVIQWTSSGTVTISRNMGTVGAPNWVFVDDLHVTVLKPTTISPSVSAVCGSTPVSLYTDSEATSFTWRSSTNGVDFGNPTTAGSPLEVTLTETTWFYYFLPACSRPGFTSDTVQIVHYPQTVAGTLSVTSATAFCNSGTAELSLSGSTGNVRLWQERHNNGTGGWTDFVTFSSAAGSTNSMAVSAVSGPYQFRTHIQSGTCGQLTTGTVNVTVDPLSSGGTLSISPGIHFYSESPELTLSTSSAVGTVAYEYSLNGTSWASATTPVAVIDQTTQYRVKATSGVCSSAYSSPVSVNIYAAPVITDNGASGIPISSITRLSVQENFSFYQWRKNNVDISGENSNAYIVAEPGVYDVRVKGSSAAPTFYSAPITIEANNYNYVRVETILSNGVTNAASIEGLTYEQKSMVTNYFDGLGRPIQTLNWRGSPTGNDVVQPIEYDAFGREGKKYLPYSIDQSNGWLRKDPIYNATYNTSEQAEFYSGSSDLIASDPVAYAVTKYESSPLNRVTGQGAPGTDWQPVTGHAISKEYLLNTANSVLDFRYNETTQELALLPGYKYYPANKLYCTRTIDEEGNDVFEYVDKEGRTICKKVKVATGVYASTYYVFDDLGNLVVVIPPEGVERILSEN